MGLPDLQAGISSYHERSRELTSALIGALMIAKRGRHLIQAAEMIANRVERHIDRVFVRGIGLQGHQSAVSLQQWLSSFRRDVARRDPRACRQKVPRIVPLSRLARRS